MADAAHTPALRKSNHPHPIPIDLLNDLSSRFVINVPEEERVDLTRVCFQIELAHWFYLDFYCEEDPKLPKVVLNNFIRIIFGHIPFLQEYVNVVDTVISNFREYKMAVPTFGAILLDKDLKNVLLVQSYVFKSSWGFPKGKVNKDEQHFHCAIREVLEETGFDISHLIDKKEYLEHHFNDQLIRLYIIPGVPSNVKFHPKTRKEIKSIEWFPINMLPTAKKDPLSKNNLGSLNFFMVLPFVNKLKKWISSKQAFCADSWSDTESSDKYLLHQQHLLSKLSQNEPANYRIPKSTYEANQGAEHKHKKSNFKMYSPPPRMLRQKSSKCENEKCQPTQEKIDPKGFRRALDFSKEVKHRNKAESFCPPFSKTWANISLDTQSLLATFTLQLRKQA